MDDIIINSILDTILAYRVRYSRNNKFKCSKLEQIVDGEKSKTKPMEQILFEDILNLFFKKSVQDGLEDESKSKELFFDIRKNNLSEDEETITHSIFAEINKKKRDNQSYSISIDYEACGNTEKLSIKVDFEEENKKSNINNSTDNKKFGSNERLKDYEINITRERQEISNENYSFKLVYENNYEEERLSLNYKSTIGTYLNRRSESLSDFTDRVPGKHMNIIAESQMGGVLGFTYIGDTFMARRADLTGGLARMVDIHESIHTPDEYETRRLTDWMMTIKPDKYIR